MIHRRPVRTSKQMIEGNYVWCDKKSNYMPKGVCGKCKKAKKCSNYNDFKYLGGALK